jgi:PPOX class probable F420-dependent enzyme
VVSSSDWSQGVASLLAAPSAAVLSTYRRNGSVLTSPVWYRWTGEEFEIVVAKDDVKAKHLERDPRCVLVVFENVRPFRGIEIRAEASVVECDATETRRALAGRYLGSAAGDAFARERDRQALIVRLRSAAPRLWDLSGIILSE